MELTIPERIEVTLRICLSLILTYIITLGSFPQVVPESQVVIIASVASAFTMVLPTLMFSIGAVVFPGFVMTALVALVFATMLLAVAATGGVNFYIGTYFLVALLLSGLRFTKAGPASALLLMVVSLNTMGLSHIAEKEGLSFVSSLWTEKGVDNPNAIVRNTLIGMCWMAVCISFARLIPPARTLRNAHSRMLLPKVLKDVASFIRLTMEYHIKDDVIDEEEDSNIGDVWESNIESPLIQQSSDTSSSAEEKTESMDDMIVKVVHNATITLVPGLAEKSIYEPRLVRVFCQCYPPVNVVTMLSDLTNAVNDMIFSSLTMRAFSKAGFQELQIHGLKDVYEGSASLLERCADALASLQLTPVAMDDVGEDEDPEDSVFDPIRIRERAMKVENLANKYIDGMLEGGQGSHFDKSARTLYLRILRPWIMGAGLNLVAAIFGCIVRVFTPVTWKRIFLPPYYDLPKLIWCMKFAIGFTALVCMHVYWPAFANLELSTKDEAKSARFSGWYLIAYAFSTTQTVEGTWKKSMLRMFGTCVGGFSAWLALNACNNSPVGLGVWLTVTNTTVAYFGLPTGLKSRFGLDKDLAWGGAYFSMTQALIVLEVYWLHGGANDITLNRIVSNLVGIAMSMVLALVPPGIFGNSPREAKFLLEDKKRAFRDCIKLVLEGSDTTALHHLYATSRAAFIDGFTEANENYEDTKQLSQLCILKPNPKMRLGLDNLAVLGSSILSLIRFGIVLMEAEPDSQNRFREGSEDRRVLESILASLDIEEDPHKMSNYHMHHRAREGMSHERPDILSVSLYQTHRVVPAHTTFTHLCIFICHYIIHRETKLDEIHWGFLGKRQTNMGRRTVLPEAGGPFIQILDSK